MKEVGAATMASMANIEQGTLDCLILDEMSDGQWHPVYKLNRNLDRGTVKAKDFKLMITEVLDRLSDEGILLSGSNESYRFTGETLRRWRILSNCPTLDDKQNQPRYFGGILEDDGWEYAPLKDYDLIHFRAEPTLTRSMLQECLSIPLAAVQIEEGLYRILLKGGAEEVVEKVREFQTEEPLHAITGIRLETGLKRRDLEDLPKQYLSDLSRYYGQFSKVLLRSHMSSILRHLPDKDDIQQQIYLWVLDAVQRYDSNTSIPFAAYLGTLLKKWVFNLNRKSFGRAVADVELKHSRAVSLFRSENARQPTQEELSELLEQSVDATKKDIQTITTVSNLRNISSINNEESETQIPAETSVEGGIDKLAKSTLISAALTTAGKRLLLERGSMDGFLATYYNTWGLEHNSKRIKSWLRNSKNQEHSRQVRKTMAEILENEGLL